MTINGLVEIPVVSIRGNLNTVISEKAPKMAQKCSKTYKIGDKHKQRDQNHCKEDV
jgi:hypothetical protein